MSLQSAYTMRWQQQRLQEGRCVRCGTPHTRISQKGKKPARHCMPCALKYNAAAKRYRDARKVAA